MLVQEKIIYQIMKLVPILSIFLLFLVESIWFIQVEHDIYLYIERERDRHIYIYIYIDINI